MRRITKIIFSQLATLLFASSCLSQDVITLRNGEDIISKVFEVTTTELKYKKFDNQNGPVFIIPKSDILMVRYENGTKDIFVNEKRVDQAPPISKAPTTNQPPVFANPSRMHRPYIASQPNEDLFIKGQMDASAYYRGYKSAGTWTFFSTLLPNTPLIAILPGLGLLPGLITAIACSASDPKEINMNFPSRDLMKERDYYNGYTYRAKKIKQGKVWTNFGISFGIAVATWILVK